MKKILLVCILLLLVFFSFFKESEAAQFSCKWNDPSGPCYASQENPDQICSPGSDPDPVCRAITTRDQCLSTINQECPDPEVPEGYCYSCYVSFGGCTLVSQDNLGGKCPYEGTAEGLRSCEIGCSSEGTNKKFACVRGSCREDASGEYPDAVSCEIGCGYQPTFAGTCYLANDHAGIQTAIGCVPIETPEEFLGFLVRWAVGVGAGISFLLIIFAGFQIMTASGDPEKLKAGQEIMSSAIAGLVLIILSVFIIEVIGVDILKLPGL